LYGSRKGNRPRKVAILPFFSSLELVEVMDVVMER
jgi:hypothetical protein